MTDQTLAPEQDYLREVLRKFNADPNDASLSEVEKILLNKIQGVQNEIAGLRQEVDKLNAEIRERQDKGTNIVEQIVHKQGQSQGYIDSLLALRTT